MVKKNIATTKTKKQKKWPFLFAASILLLPLANYFFAHAASLLRGRLLSLIALEPHGRIVLGLPFLPPQALKILRSLATPLLLRLKYKILKLMGIFHPALICLPKRRILVEQGTAPILRKRTMWETVRI